MNSLKFTIHRCKRPRASKETPTKLILILTEVESNSFIRCSTMQSTRPKAGTIAIPATYHKIIQRISSGAMTSNWISICHTNRSHWAVRILVIKLLLDRLAHMSLWAPSNMEWISVIESIGGWSPIRLFNKSKLLKANRSSIAMGFRISIRLGISRIHNRSLRRCTVISLIAR